MIAAYIVVTAPMHALLFRKMVKVIVADESYPSLDNWKNTQVRLRDIFLSLKNGQFTRMLQLMGLYLDLLWIKNNKKVKIRIDLYFSS